MAQDKKSFLLYADIKTTVDKLPMEKRGELFSMILDYVNDENPVTDDLLIEIAFEPIKQQLKRDLKRYESIVEKRKLAGQASAESRKQKEQESTHVDTCQQTPTNPTDNDTVNDTVNVNDKDNKKIERDVKTVAAKAAILTRKDNFYNSLTPFAGKYPKEMLRMFFDYWSEMNRSETKMRFEQQPTWEVYKRLATWANNEKTGSNPKNYNQERLDREAVLRKKKQEEDDKARDFQRANAVPPPDFIIQKYLKNKT